MTNTDDGVRHFQNLKSNMLSDVLNDALSLSSEEFRGLLKLGAIYVNNKRQTKDTYILENDLLRVHTKPRRYSCDFPWPSLIIFENDFFLVLNKPSGIPSHPSVDNAIENSLTQTSLARRYPLYVTHRLDTLTSGLIVYAKKNSFTKDFNIQLQKRSVVKKYIALVETTQTLPNNLTHFMNPAPGTPKKLTDAATANWPICKLEILEQKILSSKISWVKINLLTGRTHQIRAQLSHLQAPIVGDSLYGATTPFLQNSIALRSNEIEFDYKDSRMKFTLSEEFDF